MSWQLGVALIPPLVVVVVMSCLWWTRGRDPKPGTVPVQYEPPAGLTPAEVGLLLDHFVDPRDGIATLVDLSHREYLTIEPVAAPHPGSKPDYLFRLSIPPARWQGLKPHEQGFLEALFFNTLSPALRRPPDDVLRLKPRQRELWLGLNEGIFAGGTIDPQALPSFKLSEQQPQLLCLLAVVGEHVQDRLVARGYYSASPGKARARYWNYMLRVVLLTFFGGFFVLGVLSFISPPLPAAVLGALAWVGPLKVVLSLLLAFVIVAVFSQFMPARTPLGTRALRHVLGFGEFLRRVESDRFKRMVATPAEFEKYVPYAIVLGVEKRWAEAFAPVVETRRRSEEEGLVELRKILRRATQRREAPAVGVQRSGPRRN